MRLIYIDVSRKAPTKGSENRKLCVLLTVTEDAMRSELTEEFENTAAWREEKAAVHRADPRNRGAVEILRHLAATADDVPLALMSEYRAVFLRWDTSEVVRLINETLRAVGFRTYPVDATAFVREFIELVNRDRRQFETFRPRVVTTLD